MRRTNAAFGRSTAEKKKKGKALWNESSGKMNVKKWKGSMASLFTGINPHCISSCGVVYIGYRPTYVVHTHLYIPYIHPLHVGQQWSLPDVLPPNTPPATQAVVMALQQPDSQQVTSVTENTFRICVQDVIRLLLQYTLWYLRKIEDGVISCVITFAWYIWGWVKSK